MRNLFESVLLNIIVNLSNWRNFTIMSQSDNTNVNAVAASTTTNVQVEESSNSNSQVASTTSDVQGSNIDKE